MNKKNTIGFLLVLLIFSMIFSSSQNSTTSALDRTGWLWDETEVISYF